MLSEWLQSRTFVPCTPSLRSLSHPHISTRKTTGSHQRRRLVPSSAATVQEADVVIVGSGIGGLCTAALLSKYGYSVTVLEAHYHAGGAAHGFDYKGYHFDAGPSFFAGMSNPRKGASSNPLKQVLDAVDEQVQYRTYDRWMVYSPDANGQPFPCVCDKYEYAETTIRRIGGERAYRQWKELEAAMAPLGEGAALFPAAAIRADPGILLSAARFGPGLLRTAFMVKDLTGPFSNIVDRIVDDPWLRNFIDLECFVLSGMLAKDTIAAEMTYMYTERNSGKSTIDYPIGGSSAIVNALVRGIKKYGGRIMLQAPVERILVENKRAVGVKLKKNNTLIKARKAVVSNASIWDTSKLVPEAAALAVTAASTPRCGSFMHLHLGIDARGLDPNLDIHHLIVNSWNDLEAPQNVCIASIPSVFDPSLAPSPDKAVVHAYTAGNEPWDGVWDRVMPGTREYEELKEERSQCLWQALERIIPDVRERTEVKLVGTPHTHARFLNRYKGTYGPAISARKGAFPGPGTEIDGLLRCGDSTAPGIGVPAAAGSAWIASNTIASVFDHLKLLDELNL